MENLKHIVNALKKNLPIVNTILITLIFIILLINYRNAPQTEQSVKKIEKPRFKQGQEVNVNLDEIKRNSIFFGEDGQKVTLVLFNSFTCGYCRELPGTLKKIMNKYPNDLQIVYKSFLRNNADAQASHAYECAKEQGSGQKMYSLIFENGISQQYSHLADKLRLDKKAFNQCTTQKKYKNKISADMEQAYDLGINGTPAFLINNRLYIGLVDFETMDMLLQKELAL